MRGIIHRLFFLIFAIFIGSLTCHAATPKVLGIRVGDQGTYTRFVLDISDTPYCKSSIRNDGKVVDVFLSSVHMEHLKTPASAGMIKNIEVVNLPNGMGQILLRLKHSGEIKQTLTLAPNDQVNHYRYVVDIQKDASKKGAGAAPSKTVYKKPPPKPKRKVIVIDPGHGGKDPGAIGRRGIREKEVTLGVALQLEKALKATGMFDVYLTRKTDRFLRLGNRVAIARKHKADFFISLHADSHPRSDTRGLSVYTLSRVASDKEAEKLAIKENKADLIDGVDLNTESPEVANILIDLVKRETMNLSAKFAHNLIKKLSNRVLLLRNTHRFANFAVLRTPDLPGVLIEMGYISNRQDEKLLTTPKYCARLCEGIVEAVKSYFAEYS